MEKEIPVVKVVDGKLCVCHKDEGNEEPVGYICDMDMFPAFDLWDDLVNSQTAMLTASWIAGGDWDKIQIHTTDSHIMTAINDYRLSLYEMEYMYIMGKDY